MSPTYRADPALTRAAKALFNKYALTNQPPCRLAPFVLMSDPRTPQITKLASALPPHSALIYRHFGHTDRQEMAHNLRRICFERGAQFLIGQDTKLAIECGADGVHFTQNNMGDAKIWRSRIPNWILCAAAHDLGSIQKANGLRLDALILSALFPSDSPSAKGHLGIAGFNHLARHSVHPVMALGGIKTSLAPELNNCKAAGLAGVSGLITKL